MLPSSHIISKGLKRTGKTPIAYGGFADVWGGTYEARKVCVKSLRMYSNTNTNTNTNTIANNQNNVFAVCDIRNLPVLSVKAEIGVSLFTEKQLCGRD